MLATALSPSRLRRPVGALVLLAGLFVPEASSAQGAAEGPRRCTLVLEPTESTRSVSRRVGQDLYVTYLGGGMRWTCGTAVMVADSAVKYDRERRLKMMGSVDYRDSVRTLTADTLTYHEGEDRIVTEGDVHLVRRSTGSTLRGPRVVFFRATGGRVGRTVATGRPHVTVPTEGSSERDLEMDADSVVMLEDDRVRAWHDVVIRRPDARATADSAFFQTDRGRGVLYGSPTLEREDVRLSGDSIHIAFPDGQLRTVDALGGARGRNRDFELVADRIRTRMSDGETERLRATGEGRSAAISSQYRLAGDSLDFLFRDGEVDSLVARGGATAVETGEDPPEDPRQEIPLSLGEQSWMTGDTIRIAFAAPDSAAATGDTVPPGDAPETRAAGDTSGAEGDGEADDAGERGREIRMIRAMGSARAYYVMPEDTTASPGEGRVRTYELGREITAYFRNGEVERVTSRDAIGIYLEPRPSAAVPDRPDTLPPVAPDSGAVPRDTTLSAPADTTGPAVRDRAPASDAGGVG